MYLPFGGRRGIPLRLVHPNATSGRTTTSSQSIETMKRANPPMQAIDVKSEVVKDGNK